MMDEGKWFSMTAKWLGETLMEILQWMDQAMIPEPTNDS